MLNRVVPQDNRGGAESRTGGSESHEVQLGWTLASIANPHLTVSQRHDVFTNLGGGDLFSAISTLVTIIGDVGLALTGEVKDQCNRWLNGYVYHEDSPGLQTYLAQITTAQETPPTLRQAD
jgi:hypothetical protein